MSLNILTFEIRLRVNYKKNKLKKSKSIARSKIRDKNDGNEEFADLQLEREV